MALDVSVKAGAGGKLNVMFTVSDSGIGLSLAEIRRLFKPFSQANVSIASRFGGAGLGLSSVKQLARAMGGDISANQRSGGGIIRADSDAEICRRFKAAAGLMCRCSVTTVAHPEH